MLNDSTLKTKMQNNRTIFITGGASGIGAASVEHFLSNHYNVVFIDINEEKSQKLVEKLDSPQVLFFKADVSDQEQVKSALSFTLQHFGRIDAVFANAGIYFPGDILSTSAEDFDYVLSHNVKGVYFTLQASIPLLIQNGGGSIILMGSDQSLIGKKESFVYGMTKGAIGQMTKSLALDYAEHNIRVNCVCPGTIDTDLSRTAIERSAKTHYDNNIDKALDVASSAQPLKRMGQPDEVAKVVAFLASDDSSFITGTLIPIDGGYTAQ